jgi:hypothetical protein
MTEMDEENDALFEAALPFGVFVVAIMERV